MNQQQIDASLPVERFRTRGGRKVIKVVDTGLDIDYPIIYLLTGNCNAFTVTRTGKFNITASDRDADLIQLPAPDEFKSVYVNAYSDGRTGGGHHTRYDADTLAEAVTNSRHPRVAVIEVITNVTKGTVKTKVHKV